MSDCRRTQVHRERFLFMTDWSMLPPCASRRPNPPMEPFRPQCTTGIPEEPTGAPQMA